MVESNNTTRDTGALGVLTEQIRVKGDPNSELFNLLIARLACTKAQVRGCAAGPEMADWMQAEAEVHAMHQRPLYPTPEESAKSPAPRPAGDSGGNGQRRR